jgi:hypothetical protein
VCDGHQQAIWHLLTIILELHHILQRHQLMTMTSEESFDHGRGGGAEEEGLADDFDGSAPLQQEHRSAGDGIPDVSPVTQVSPVNAVSPGTFELVNPSTNVSLTLGGGAELADSTSPGPPAQNGAGNSLAPGPYGGGFGHAASSPGGAVTSGAPSAASRLGAASPLHVAVVSHDPDLHDDGGAGAAPSNGHAPAATNEGLVTATTMVPPQRGVRVGQGWEHSRQSRPRSTQPLPVRLNRGGGGGQQTGTAGGAGLPAAPVAPHIRPGSIRAPYTARPALHTRQKKAP